MFGSTILELGIGLIFTFLAISLLTSAATEGLASALKWRANTLLDGVKDLLNDPKFTGLALGVYNHALVNARADGAASTEAQLTAKPSYIVPKQFACALMDVVALSPGADVAAMQAKVNAVVTNKQLNTMLNGMIVRAGGNINRIRDEIAAWFDSGMDRVAGVYKRKTQLYSFLIAVVLAGALNVDTLKIADTLWHQPMVMKDLPQLKPDAAPGDALAAMEKLQLPFGWDAPAVAHLKNGTWPLWISIFGWLFSALATLFGAPFWFDALQKIVQLRGAGSS